MVRRAGYLRAVGGALHEYRDGRRADPSWTRASWGHHAFLTQAFASIALTLLACGIDVYGSDPIAAVGPSGARFLDYLGRTGELGPRVRGVFLGEDGTLPVATGSMLAVVLSLVLSELPSPLARSQMARECRRILAPGGLVVCWDARMPNPRNPHVDTVGRRELARLFPDCRIESRSLTLMPPVARRLGSATPIVYPALEVIPVLRSHLLATIQVGARERGREGAAA